MLNPGDLVQIKPSKAVLVWSNPRKPVRVQPGAIGIVIQVRRSVGRSKILLSTTIGWIPDCDLELVL